jgi:hypothetical protein
MLNLVGRSAALSHEDVFIARYAALVLAASLTRLSSAIVDALVFLWAP